MNRILLLIAVLFGMVSISSPAMASAVATGQFWTVADQQLCVEAASAESRAPAYKPCAKKINGHAVLCQHAVAVLPAAVAWAFARQPCAFSASLDRAHVFQAKSGPYRPPQVG